MVRRFVSAGCADRKEGFPRLTTVSTAIEGALANASTNDMWRGNQTILPYLSFGASYAIAKAGG